MDEPLASIKKFAVMSIPQMPKAEEEGKQVAAYLQQLGYSTVYGLMTDERLRQRVRGREFDMLIAVGGDGTMLRAGHLCAPAGVPILGINMGHFGFLTEVRQDQWREVLPRPFNAEYWLERHMMLLVELHRDGRHLGSWDVLNEVVVCRGQIVHPIHLSTEVDGRFLTTYVADGLIAATATGSTAYALAVGGPILPPELRNILLVPIAPHLSVDRALVLSEGSSVVVTVIGNYPAIMSGDGQPPVDLQSGDRVTVKAGEYAVKFVRFQDPGYFYRNLTPHMNQNPVTGNSHK